MSHDDDRDETHDPRAVQRRLFAGLMRTKTLPMVPDQTPSNTPDAPEPQPTSRPSFAASSKGLLALKQELLARGMSDDEAEEFLRMI